MDDKDLSGIENYAAFLAFVAGQKDEAVSAYLHLVALRRISEHQQELYLKLLLILQGAPDRLSKEPARVHAFPFLTYNALAAVVGKAVLASQGIQVGASRLVIAPEGILAVKYPRHDVLIAIGPKHG